jgi:trimeric autotransporter adhesin
VRKKRKGEIAVMNAALLIQIENVWRRISQSARSLAFVLVFATYSGVASAAPAPANSVIGNQASATYVDSAGTTRPVTSNTVQTTVLQVKSFIVTQTGARNAPTNQQVCYPHTITNTGNGPDSYTLNAPTTGGMFAHTGLAYFADTNQDGIPDSQTAIAAPVLINAGASFNFVVCGTTPTTATLGQVGTISATVTDTASTTSAPRVDTTTIGAAAIELRKKLSSVPPPGYIPVTGGASPNTGPLFVILEYTNTGTFQADNVRLTDALPSGWIYVPGSGRWTGSGPSTALTDPAMGDPAGISYQAPISAVSGTVLSTVVTVPGSTGGSVYFQVTIPAGLPVTTLANAATTTNIATVQYSYTFMGITTNVPSSPSNPVQYLVGQAAGMSVNGSPTTTGTTDMEPVTAPAVAPGQTVTFTDYVWNRGNSPDSYDVILRDGTSSAAYPNNALGLNGAVCNPASSVVDACTFPQGTTFQILSSNGATALLDTNGNGIPDTGTIPLPVAGSCAVPYITSADGLSCGYAVIVRATLPANAMTGNNGGAGYRVTLEGRSRFDPTRLDTVVDTLASITPNGVDITNNAALAGTGVLGTGPENMMVQVTNSVTPLLANATTTVFTLYANNTGATPAVYNLSSSFVSVPGMVGLTTPPAGWVVTFRESGNGMNCVAPLGMPMTTTGTAPVPTGGSRLYCAEVSVPPTNVSTMTTPTASPPGAYVVQFGITNQTNPAITDTIRDQVTVLPVRNVTITPNNMQATVAGGTVTYTHVISNLGNLPETVTFPAGFLTNSQVPAFGWTSVAYIDTNGNGVLDAADTQIVPGTTSIPNLLANATRTLFVVVTAPPATGSPANVTTLTASFNSGSGTASVTDTTTLTDGLRLQKFQQLPAGNGSCTTVPSAVVSGGVPNAPWSATSILPSVSTLPGKCIAYLIVGNNTSTANVTNISVTDLVPANTQLELGCGAPAVTGPIALVGSYPGGFTGTVTAQSSPSASTPLAPAQTFTVQFCVRINTM